MVKVKEHTRKINGKVVPVREHQRKEEIKNAFDSLVERRKKEYENMKTINATRPRDRGRRITDNDSVAYAFSRREGNVRNGNDSFATDETGRVAYSYNTPIAYRGREGKVFVNSDKFSSTTSTQINKIINYEGKDNIRQVTSKQLMKVLEADKINYTKGRLRY